MIFLKSVGLNKICIILISIKKKQLQFCVCANKTFLFQIIKMARSMDDDFTYFVKIVDDNGDRYYLKSSIDERTNTILMQLTNLKIGWIGTCKYHI